MDKPVAKDPGQYCPLWKKAASKVCHTCVWYVHVKGKHPQTEEIMDHWACAISWGPMLAVNIAQQVNGVQAATETFRNNMTTVGQTLVAQNREARVSHTPDLKRIG